MDNVIKGKFNELEDVGMFIQNENGEKAIDVALGLNDDIDMQGFCDVTVYHSDTNKPTPFEPDQNCWLISYRFPDGYCYSYDEAEFKNLEDACYFVLFCHIICSKIKNKSIICTTPGDAFEAIKLKKETKFKIKIDLCKVSV